MTLTKSSAVRIAVLYPEVLGTYGDGGNGLALVRRLQARDLPVERLDIGPEQTVPLSCDIYLLGGSEDGPQEYVAGLLAQAHLERAVERGAALVGVCSGMQLLGREFPGADRRPSRGLELLPCKTVLPANDVKRAVGDVVLSPVAWSSVGQIVGFENHRGQTILDPDAVPLGRCLKGFGNNQWSPASQRADGVVRGRILGTYLHGPVLALNPLLADAVLGQVVGAMPPVDDPGFDGRVALARRRRFARPRRRVR
jgi:lipid II isoglutaminyl synthase (glutamine-hydrolysing)